jgi:hypothetical protein
MLATPANMERLRRASGDAIAAPGVVAYSLNTGEQCSASPGDYWDRSPNEPLRDAVGEPMLLGRIRRTFEPADSLIHLAPLDEEA